MDKTLEWLGADDACEDCDGTGEVEKNINGCEVMVECSCLPCSRFYGVANTWQRHAADDAGVPMYAKLNTQGKLYEKI